MGISIAREIVALHLVSDLREVLCTEQEFNALANILNKGIETAPPTLGARLLLGMSIIDCVLRDLPGASERIEIMRLIGTRLAAAVEGYGMPCEAEIPIASEISPTALH